MDNQTIQNVSAPTITPHLLPNEGIQALTLLDAKRAMPIETATNIIADLKNSASALASIFTKKVPTASATSTRPKVFPASTQSRGTPHFPLADAHARG